MLVSLGRRRRRSHRAFPTASSANDGNAFTGIEGKTYVFEDIRAIRMIADRDIAELNSATPWPVGGDGVLDVA